MKREDVICLFPEQIREILRQADWNPEELQEIRLRAGKPLILRQQGKEYFLSRKGMLTRHKELAYLVSQEQIRTTVMPYVLHCQSVCHTLIISPPRCGKTTLLRDLIRQLSDGTEEFPGCTVGVVDERSEIGGSYQGIPQNDVGIRTDLLDCCPKAEGMMMLIRSMSPEVIAVDEIGNYEDINGIEMILNSGCKLLATVHGSSIEDIQKKPLLERMIREHVFERYIILQGEDYQGAGNISRIYDGRGTCLYQKEGTA